MSGGRVHRDEHVNWRSDALFTGVRKIKWFENEKEKIQSKTQKKEVKTQTGCCGGEWCCKRILICVSWDLVMSTCYASTDYWLCAGCAMISCYTCVLLWCTVMLLRCTVIQLCCTVMLLYCSHAVVLQLCIFLCVYTFCAIFTVLLKH